MVDLLAVTREWRTGRERGHNYTNSDNDGSHEGNNTAVKNYCGWRLLCGSVPSLHASN